MNGNKYLTLPTATLGLGLTSAGVWGMLNSETLKALISDAWREDIIRMMVAFTFAMLITRLVFRKDVEKSVTNIVTPIVDALNKIADKSEATDNKLHEINNKVVENSADILMLKQHLTPRQN